MRRLAGVAAVMVAAAGVGGCSGGDGTGDATGDPTEVTEAGMTVRDPWARPTAPDIDTAAIYLTVENRSAPDDRIVGASAPSRCATVVPHLTVVDSDGVASMPSVLGDELHLPQGGSVVMEPIGLHLMCLGLGSALDQGDDFDLTLEFETHAPMTFTVSVEQR